MTPDKKVEKAPFVPPFVRFVASAIPMVFDDSMSYYECLAALTHYLQHDIVDVINNNAAVTEEYIQLTKDMKEYMDNYFDNLDVQEEINNKLDQMAEDGTLQEIITAYIQANVAWVFDTVEDMKAATNLIEGSYARTLGYTTLDDKMGGLYIITTSSSGNIPLDDGTLYAHHLKENATVSIDDYDGATAEDRLFAALDDIATGTIIGGDITITKQYNAGAKDYRKIIITNCNLDIQYDHWFDQNGSSYQSVPTFSNCTINGNGNTFYVGEVNCVGPNFNNCIFNGNICIFNSNSKYIQSPYFVNCQMYSVANLITSYGAYDLKMIGCRIESSAGKLVVITSTDGLRQGTISSCLIEGRNDVVFEISSIYDLYINGCYFEGCNGGIVSQTLSNGSALLRFKNNIIFAPMTGTDYVITLASSGYQRALVSENTTNLPNGKYLCNKNLPYYGPLGYQNVNYGNVASFANNGFPASGIGAYDKIAYIYQTPTFDSTDNTWVCKIRIKGGEAYASVSPFLLSFVGSIGSSTVYRGYANLLVTPRVGYANSAVSLLCDVKILDACNTINATPSSTVTATASVNTTSYAANDVEITIKIGGFSSSSGKFRAVDMLELVSIQHEKMS